MNTAPLFSAGSGKVLTDFGNSFDQSTQMLVQNNGQILLVGYRLQDFNKYVGTKNDFALARFNSDGSLDLNFGINGLVINDFTLSHDWAYSVQQQLDGKIIVGGRSENGLAIAKYNSSGTLDLNFGTQGKLTSNIDGKLLKIQSDGKILIAGSKDNDNLLTRYLSNGDLDVSFGTSGTAYSNFNTKDIYLRKNVTGLAIQPDGKIIIESYGDSSWDGGSSSFSLVRFNINGTLDNTFGQGGMITTPVNTYNSNSSLTIQSDGKLLVTGSIYDNNIRKLLLMRYESNGASDASFGNNGKVITSITGRGWDQGNSLAVQDDGKIVVAGSNDYDIFVVRYNINGSLDLSFDEDGYKIIDLGYFDSNSGIAIKNDGAIYVSGNIRNSDGSIGDFALIKLNSDGTLDKSFSKSTPFNEISYSENESVILCQDLSINDFELSSIDNYNGASLTIIRHGGANSDDTFSSGDSLLSSLIQNSYFSYNGITIGRVTSNVNGKLTLLFNDNATLSLVNKSIQRIAYFNKSDAPSSSIQLDWIFSDGNSGAQGAGGALSTTGVLTLNVSPVNDYPRLSTQLTNLTIAAGAPLNFAIPTNSFTDPDIEGLTYTAKMADGSGVPPWLKFSPSTQTFSGTPENVDIGILNILLTAKDAGGLTAQGVFSITVTSPVPSYILTASNSAVNEGSIATFVLSTKYIASGSAVPYTITGVSAADVSSGLLSGNAIIDANGVATISIALVNDSLTEGAETLTVDVKGYKATTIINDTSKAATYAITSKSINVDEGMNAIFILTTTSVVSGTSVPYTITGVSAADVSSGLLSGNAIIDANGVATISIALVNDSLTEGAETLTVDVKGYKTTTIINDTSKDKINYEAHSISVIVDKNVLGASPNLLKELKESITFTNGVITKHIVEYSGLTFDYNQIDSLITTVTRDGEFTPEFTKEINEYLNYELNIPYSAAVKLVGATSIDGVILSVAGADGNFVG